MPDTTDLYQVLGVERSASQAEIKKAYYQLCLKLHPDKNPGNEEAKAKFQSLQRVYGILGDVEKRATYDQTGITDDDLLGGNASELASYFRSVYRKVTEEDIDTFYDQYRGSNEEKADLLKLYNEHKGDMDMVFQWLMCSVEDLDSHRFMDTINAAVEQGDAKSYKKYKSWCKEVSSRPRPSDPLKKRAGSHKGGASTALVASIQHKRKEAHDAFVSQLEAKYAVTKGEGKKKAKKSSKAASEPTDEEFEAARKRLEEQQSATGKKRKAPAGSSKTDKQKTKAGSKKGTKEVDLEDHTDEDDDEQEVEDVDDEEDKEGDDGDKENDENESRHRNGVVNAKGGQQQLAKKRRRTNDGGKVQKATLAKKQSKAAQVRESQKVSTSSAKGKKTKGK